MGIKRFSQVTANDRNLGGKAWGLAQLAQKGFPVPPGLVITESLQEQDWQEVLHWWREIAHPPLAVRSSGGAEDSANLSFAGQNQTFLDVKNEVELKAAIEKCFASVERAASRTYREHFAAVGGKDAGRDNARMNVVLQEMVQPLFSGVFFSQDPRTGDDEWILEVVHGIGEKLVSGKVTPGRFSRSGKAESLPAGFASEDAFNVAEIGMRVAASEGYALDMEWGMDESREIYVLQSRPITTLRHDKQKIIDEELKRLESQYSSETLWDGQTFSEWSGFPSYFTFSIWRNAFSPRNAFGNALGKFGYQSFADQELAAKFSLLERVLGRAYVNLDRLSDLYYGPIPYRIEPKPRPHTKFDWRKLSPSVILHTPKAISQMVLVAWNLSAKRSEWLAECKAELVKFRETTRAKGVEHGQIDSATLQRLLIEKANEFSRQHLYWPLVLVVLMESTLQRLQVLLDSIVGKEHSSKMIRDWLGKGSHTVTADMRAEYQKAAANPALQPAFLFTFGHRCPGEMDLANPRWSEIGLGAFRKERATAGAAASRPANVEEEIIKLDSFKREVVLEEWRLLKQMLELREEWKMEILKPYAQIRALLVELGSRWSLGDDIHWLRLSEVAGFSANFSPEEQAQARVMIERRKKRFAVFKEYNFPPMVSLDIIKGIINGKPSFELQKSFDGEALSSGIVRGRVRVVSDFAGVDAAAWPEDAVLVAETTDPGWTPLFVKSRAVVIQNGGVLSHCAIVAREMGIPAVSGIMGCHKVFKDDDIIWVDGNNGRVHHESMA